MDTPVLLSMTGISKAFPGVQALAKVDFTLRSGEIHALMGENGAGKSTLIKVLTGVHPQDSGSILLEGREIHPKSPLHAQTLGITAVYQEVNLCPNLSVAENVLLGREPHRRGRIDWRALNQRAREIMTWLGIDVDVRQSVGMYPVAIQQMVAIARALEVEARVLIVDEPTSSLSAHETDKLFEVLRKLRAEGMGVVFITHFLDQVYEIADRITVLRNGNLVGSAPTAEMPRYALVEKMIGRELAELENVERFKQAGTHVADAAPYLVADNLGRVGEVEPMDLVLYQGEVLGFAGLLGSGRTETANLLFGVEAPDSGSLTVNGKRITRHTPLTSIKHAMGYCPEDRKAEGIVGELTVRENIILALQAQQGWFNYLSRRKQNEIADTFIKLLKISTPSNDQLMKNLSGGNQQKVIVARWLATQSHILILDEPTRGIDIGTKAEIQKLVLQFAGEGKACIFISSELDEVLRTSHRVVVLRDRKLVAEYSGDTLSEQAIMQTIAGSPQ